MAAVTSPDEHGDISFPDINSIDTKAVEVFYDVDLDELTVLYFGRRHSLHEIGSNLYALVDMTTGDAVGFEIHQFVKKAIPQHPRLRNALSLATILGNAVNEQALNDESSTERSSTIRAFLKGLVEPRSMQIREVLRSVTSMRHV